MENQANPLKSRSNKNLSLAEDRFANPFAPACILLARDFTIRLNLQTFPSFEYQNDWLQHNNQQLVVCLLRLDYVDVQLSYCLSTRSL